MKVFAEDEPSLQGITELQIKFIDVSGVSGATIELTVLGCAEVKVFAEDEPSLQGITELQIKFIDVSGVSGATIELTVLGCAEEVSTTTQTTTSSTVSTTTPQLSTTPGYCLENMDGEEGLQEGFTPTSDLITLQVENGTTYIKFESLPLEVGDNNLPSVDGILTRSASIRAISIRLVPSSSSSTPSPTGNEELVSVTINFFTKKERNDDFKPLLLEDSQEPKVITFTPVSDQPLQKFLKLGNEVIEGVVAFRVTVLEVTGVSSATLELHVLGCAEEFTTTQVTTTAVSVTTPTTTTEESTSTVAVTTPTQTTTERTTTSTTSLVSTTEGYCLQNMDSESGVETKDQTRGNLLTDESGFLTFSELPIEQSVGNSAVLERKFNSNINVRGVLITLKKITSSVTSGQAEGTTTPKTGSTSPQSVKFTFTLLAKRVDETDFKQVVIKNTITEFTLTIEGIQSEVKVFAEDEPSLQGITELQIKFIDVSGVSGATIELTVLGCAEEVSTTTQTTTSSTVSTTTPQLSTTPGYCLENMDGEEGLQEGFTPTSDLITLQVENGTTYIKFESLPLEVGDNNLPSVDGILTRSASIRAISIRLVPSSSSSTPSPTGNEELVSVTINFFTKKERNDDFKPLLLEDSQEPKVITFTPVSDQPLQKFLKLGNEVIEGVVAFRVTVLEVTGVSSATLELHVLGCAEEFTTTQVTTTAVSVTTPTTTTEESTSTVAFTLSIEGIQSEMKVFPMNEPSLEGIKELQIKFIDVSGVSGATIELTVLGCAEGLLDCDFFLFSIETGFANRRHFAIDYYHQGPSSSTNDHYNNQDQQHYKSSAINNSRAISIRLVPSSSSSTPSPTGNEELVSVTINFFTKKERNDDFKPLLLEDNQEPKFTLTIEGIQSEMKVFAEDEPSLQGITELQIKFIDVSGVSGATIELTVLGCAEEVSTTTQTTTSSTVSTTTPQLSTTPGYCLEKMDGEEGLQEGFTPTSDLITLQVENGTTYIKFESLPLEVGDNNLPSVDGILTRSASIRAISIRLVPSSSSSTPSPTGNEELVSVTINFFTKKERNDDFKPLLLEDNQEPKVITFTPVSDQPLQKFLKLGNEVIEGVVAFRVTVLEVTGVSSATLELHVLGCAEEFTTTQVTTTAVSVTTPTTTTEESTSTVAVTTPTQTTTERTTTSTTSLVSTTEGYCLQNMDSESGVETKDQTRGNLLTDESGFLTFSELPIEQSVGNSAVLERKFSSNINVRGVLITLKKITSSVTSGQAEGTTTPKTGSTSPQSVKFTFTLLAKRVDETDFKQVVIKNTITEFTLTIEGIQSEVKVFAEDEPSLQGITELQIKFIDVSGVSGATIELTVLGCAEEVSTTVQTTTSSTVSTTTPKLSTTPGYCLENMDGEEGLQEGFTPTSDLITLQVENGTTYIKFESLPLEVGDNNLPSVDGILTRSASIRAISIRLVPSSSSSTPSPTGNEELVSVTINFFTKKERNDDFKPLLLEDSQEPKVITFTPVSDQPLQKFLKLGNEVIEGVVAFRVTVLEVTGVSSATLELHVLGCAEEFTTTQVTTTAVSVTTPTMTTEESTSTVAFTLTIEGIQSEMKVFAEDEPSLQGITELQIKFIDVSGVSGATIELTVLGCAEEVSTTTQTTTSSTVSTTTPQLSTTPGYCLENMDGEEGLQEGFTPTSDLITLQVENGTTYIKFESLPLEVGDNNLPSVDGILTRSASIRAISIRLVPSSSSSTPSPTGNEELVSVTINFFTKKERNDDFKPLLLEDNQEPKVITFTPVSDQPLQKFLKLGNEVIEGVVAFRVTVLEVTGVSSATLELHVLGCAEEFTTTQVTTTAVSVTTPTTTTEESTSTVAVTTPTQTTTERTTTSTTSLVSTTEGYCLQNMDSESGVETKDQTRGNLLTDESGFLTFSELPIEQSVGNSAVLERKFSSNINVRGVLITLKKITSSVTSGQAEGTTTPKTGSTSPQSVKFTFTLLAKRVDETDFKQVVIKNTITEFTLTIEGIQSEVKVFAEDEPSLQGITELQIKFIDVSGVSGATIELTVLGCAEEVSTTTQTTTSSTVSTTTPQLSTTPGYCLENMDGEEGLQEGFTPTSDLITLQVENGTTYIKFESLPLEVGDNNLPSVDGILTRSASIRAISIRLVPSSSSSTPSPTGNEELVSVTINFFTKKERNDDFKPLLLEDNQEPKVITFTPVSDQPLQKFLKLGNEVIEGVVAFRVTVLEVTGVSSATLELHVLGCAEEFTTTQVTTTAVSVTTPTTTTEESTSTVAFTLTIEGIQSEVKVFAEDEPSLQGITELQIKFIDVSGVSGATIELTVLGCAEVYLVY
ncbi:uncharacterized protein [Asterias amurensis]|uniref:uncharacterized protein n=1 Tax=Asterias amurensis TaxID=7602 RepID=UPI003AB7C2BD